MFKTFYLAKIIHKLHIPSFKNCTIHKTSRLCSGCSLTNVVMGRYSYAGDNTRITDAEIGNFCSIGENCSIGGGIHPLNMVSTSPVFLKGRNIMRTNFSNYPYSPSKKVTIGHDVWIGNYTFIKAGVSIGTGAVIGAHAVVVHDVEPYSIVAGIPARKIRLRFGDDIIKKLLKIEWWNLDEERLKKLSEFFDSPEKLIIEFEKNRMI